MSDLLNMNKILYLNVEKASVLIEVDLPSLLSLLAPGRESFPPFHTFLAS